MKKKLGKISVWLCTLALVVASASVVKAVGVNGLTSDTTTETTEVVAPTTTKITNTVPVNPNITTAVAVTKVDKPQIVTKKNHASGNASRETTTVAPTTTVEPTITTTVEVSSTTTGKNIKKPKKVAIKKKITKKKSSKEVKFTFKKISNTKGYQVAIYTSNKNAKNNKKPVVKKFVKNTKVKMVSKKLKNKKTLFVKVRAYKLNGKEKVYGNWSKATKVKVKK